MPDPKPPEAAAWPGEMVKAAARAIAKVLYDADDDPDEGELAAARAALQAAAPWLEPEGWQPIERAPRDGTPVLGWISRWNCYHAVAWLQSGWAVGVRETGYMHVPEPDYWMPLPAAPKPPDLAEGEGT